MPASLDKSLASRRARSEVSRSCRDMGMRFKQNTSPEAVLRTFQAWPYCRRTGGSVTLT